MERKMAAGDVRHGDTVTYSDSFAKAFAQHPPNGDDEAPREFCHDCYRQFRSLKGVAVADPGYGNQVHVLWNPQPHHDIREFNAHEHVSNGDYDSGSFHGVPSAMDAKPEDLMHKPHIANEFLEDLEVTGVHGDSAPATGDWKPEGWDLTASQRQAIRRRF